jgi:hypothetical protein
MSIIIMQVPFHEGFNSHATDSYFQTKERYRQGSGGVTQLTKSLAQVRQLYSATLYLQTFKYYY